MNIYSLDSSKNNSNYFKHQLSFKGNAEKLIEKFKDPNFNINGQQISRDDLLSVMTYFGWHYKGTARHKQIEDFYGNKYMYRADSQADPNFAAVVIRGVKLADEFDGALFIFDTQPTPEEIEKFKKLIKENPPYLDARNKYARELKKQKDSATQEINTDTKNENKTLFEKISTQRLFQIETESKIAEIEENIETLKIIVEEQKDNFPNETSLNDIYEDIEKACENTEIIIGLTKTELYKLAAKLQTNTLADNSIIQSIENEMKLINECFQKIELVAEELNQAILEISENKKTIKNEIISTCNDVNALINDLSTKIAECEKNINAGNDCEQVSQELIGKLEKEVSELRKKANKANNKLSKIEPLDDKSTTQEFAIQLKSVREIKDKIALYLEQAAEITNEIERKILPIITISQEDMRKTNAQRIAKFNEKTTTHRQDTKEGLNECKSEEIEQTEDIAQITEEIMQVETIAETQTEEQIEPKTSIETQANEIIIENKPIRILIKHYSEKNKAVSEPKNISNSKAEKIEQITSAWKIYFRDENNDPKKKFAYNLAKKLAPIPIDSAISSLALLIRKESAKANLELLKTQQNLSMALISSIGNKVINSKEAEEIKNASRIALLYSLYINTDEQNEKIYSLDSKTSREVFEKIKNNQREFTLNLKSEIIKMKLNKNLTQEAIDKMFLKFKSKMSESAWLEETLKELLKYSPDNSEEIAQNARELLKEKGCYLELILDCEDEPTLKRILLEAFWSDFDDRHNTQYYNTIASELDKIQKELKEQAQHEEKIKLFESLNWEL